MKRLFKILLLMLFMYLPSEETYALTIVSPTEGQIVYQGDRLTVIVKPDTGEKWEEVLLDIYPMSYSTLTNDYREEIVIPKDKTGNIYFTISAYDKTGREIESKRNLFVKFPSNVLLQSIKVQPNPLFLEKLPVVSEPDDIRVFGTGDLHVFGIYSDGVNREVTSFASGTTYKSNNESIVTVSPEGKATAHGIGKTTITVRNGNLSVDVRVIVDPYKE